MTDLLVRRHSPVRNSLNIQRSTCAPISTRSAKRFGLRLRGKTPFSGRTMEEIHRAQKSSVLPLEQLKAAHVPSGLRSLLESMLAFEPASLPGTHELAARLHRCAEKRSCVTGLKRRDVYRVAVACAVAAWLLIQAASILFPT